MNRFRWAGAAALAVLLLVGILWSPPYLIISPGSAIDLTDDITITGIATGKPTGKYLLVTVRYNRATLVRMAAAGLSRDLRVVPESRLVAPGMSRSDYLKLQQEVFVQSRQAAAAAAARSLGMTVATSGAGATVVDIQRESPAAEVLRVGDVITAIDTTAVRTVSDLIAITTGEPAGTGFHLKVDRDNQSRAVRVRSARLGGFTDSGTGIGVLTTTKELRIDLPFGVEFKKRNIGGPSAGLVYALAIADMLSEADLAAGRVVAASGAIQLDGAIGSVGGLTQKSTVARKAGADLFLVPEADLSGAAGSMVKGVKTLSDTLDLLAQAG
ncbi:MAG: PDZ domain-containing protein [Actinomycetota bacterium]